MSGSSSRPLGFGIDSRGGNLSVGPAAVIRNNEVGDHRGSCDQERSNMPSRGNGYRGGDRRGVVIVLLLAALAGVAVGRAPAPPAPQAASAADPLMILNESFRAAYRRTKEANLARNGPVILMEGDNIVLRRGGTRLEVPYTPAVYHVLKSVAHVPLMLDVLLAPHADEATLTDAALAELRDYRKLMEQAEPSLAAQGLEPEQLERQKKIFADCRAFL